MEVRVGQEVTREVRDTGKSKFGECQSASGPNPVMVTRVRHSPVTAQPNTCIGQRTWETQIQAGHRC